MWPVSHLKSTFEGYSEDVKGKVNLIFQMKSDFEISLIDLDDKEKALLSDAVTEAFTADDDERAYAKKKAEREARAKAAEARTRLAAVQAAADAAARAAAEAASRKAEAELLESLGDATPKKKKGGKKKGAPASDSGSAAPSASAAVMAVGSSGAEPLTEEGPVGVGGSAASASGALEALPEKAPAASASSSGFRMESPADNIMFLGSAAAAGGAGGSSLGTDDDEARPSRPINPSEGKRPAHHTVIPVVGPFDRIDRQHAAPSEGLDPRAKTTLAVFLGAEVEGAVRAVRTVDWDDTVHLLKRLGFDYVARDIFMDGKNRRLILDQLHYDENRMNPKAKAILLRQLAAYDFTHDALIRYLG